MTDTPVEARADGFDGSTDHLLTCIDAFLDLTDEKAFVPHNLDRGSHAYRLLVAARVRLEASIQSEAKTLALLVTERASRPPVAGDAPLGPMQSCPACSTKFQMVHDVDAHLAALSAPPTPEPAEVTGEVIQADRDAAADLHTADCCAPLSPYDRRIDQDYRAGKHDDWNDVLAFARHRLKFSTARRDEDVERAALAIAEIVYGPGFDPFMAPELYDHFEKLALAALSKGTPE